jgi:SnoaL-like domain
MALPRALAVAAIVGLLAGATWFLTRPDDEGAPIRQRLQSLADAVNRSTMDGAGPQARAKELAAYFTEDVDVELGGGAAPIRGRETLMGMAERLQPRTAMFKLKLEDVTVAMSPGGDAADVHLAAEFIRRSMTSGEESLDAREFTISMRRVDNEWLIARVTAIDTLK